MGRGNRYHIHVMQRGFAATINSRNNKQIDRRQLFPFIKKIHPDLFAQEKENIRLANLTCVQTLYELWDFIESMEQSIDLAIKHQLQQQQQLHIDILKPLQNCYKLVCFIRNEASGINGTERISCELRPHSILCNRHRASTDSIRKALQGLCAQVGHLFVSAGLLDPWHDNQVIDDEITYNNSDNNSDNNLNFETDVGKFTSRLNVLRRYEELDAIVFERLIRRQHGLSSESNSFDLNNSSFRGGRALNTTTSRDRVDTFIRSGHILVQGLSSREEFEATQRLRQFLIEFGSVINFASGIWRRVVFVICCPVTAALEGIGVGVATGEQSLRTTVGKKQSKSRKFYKCEQAVGGRYILRIPFIFKDAILLEHIRNNVPDELDGILK